VRTSSSDSVADAFNRMAEEYDDLQDVWYPHFFRTIERIVTGTFPSATPATRVLDVGCGTGLQSHLFRSLGYDVTGVDIAADLIEKARAKCSEPDAHLRFQVASAMDLPFADGKFDIAVCCGGVLGFVPDHRKALAEIARIIRPGGRALIEVDTRWNLDLLWALGDNLTGGWFGYEQPFKESVKNIVTRRDRGVDIRYPFTKLDGEVEYLYSHLFTTREIEADCEAVGFRVEARRAIHSVSNILPSTWLAHPKLPGILRKLIDPVLKLDNHVSSRLPFLRLGNSYVLTLRRALSD
jgi:ubiquinone/menaquinone biosynthesis C-methylase UbiE